MRPLNPKLVTHLDLKAAVLAEVAATRNLVPPEPWLDAVNARHEEVVSWVRTRLLTGQPNSSSPIVSARKAGHGIRPVPIVGIAERIAYRALTAHILSGLELAKRTPEEYKEFIQAPIDFAFAHRDPGRVTFAESRVGYVVEADVIAFYQYIDHDVLRQELLMQTGEVEATEHLVELLADIAGRQFGIPQLLEPSDWLSEIYIRAVERNIARKGLPVWRFNDDFRIACKDYRSALRSLEELSSAARDVGLVIGEHKTITRTFSNYVLAYTGMDVDQQAAAFDPQDVEVAVSDYFDLEPEASVASAVATLSRIDAGPPARSTPGQQERPAEIDQEFPFATPSDLETPPARIDLKNLHREDFRLLRSAISALARNGDPRGLQWLKRLFQFATPLTPQLVNYLTIVGSDGQEESAQIWDALKNESDSDWQSLWLVNAARRMNILKDHLERIQWVEELARGRHQETLRAEAYLALASIGKVGFDELDFALRNASDALAPWYVLAMKSLQQGPLAPTDKEIQAIRQSSPIYSILLKQ
ncbi:RNA-directed DNA polymerase [Micromonospora sp. C31]|uniref:RNA-directed DNA polymerase n=1 Tax=Micromonospora sp. C31 TaxID=2824876 RepID=UPI001B39C2A9|nr:RNA-directed DNA polymerase [Micromonospora sp. C31]MBQ1072834.1 RNA-directed DNA polymerase [Micromonospora sp. C31]